MAIHPKLAPYSSEKNIKKFSKLLKGIEDDLHQVACENIEVELRKEGNGESKLERFQPLDEGTLARADQWMVVTASRQGRTVVIWIPMAKGVSLPYQIVLGINAKTNTTAVYGTGFVGKRWNLEPENEGRAQQLMDLNLPDITWVHTAGSHKLKLDIAHEITASEENADTARWIVNSGYHGFVFGIRPKVAVYIEAVQKLEALLESWTKSTVIGSESGDET